MPQTGTTHRLQDNVFGKARRRKLYCNTATTDNAVQKHYLKVYITGLGLYHHHQMNVRWQVFWLPCPQSGLPIASEPAPATVARGGFESFLRIMRKTGSQRRVRTGFSPVSLFTQSGHQQTFIPTCFCI
jgi:hypothetical protein